MKLCEFVLKPTASHCIFVVIIGMHVLFQRVRKGKCLRGELHILRNTQMKACRWWKSGATILHV